MQHVVVWSFNFRVHMGPTKPTSFYFIFPCALWREKENQPSLLPPSLQDRKRDPFSNTQPNPSLINNFNRHSFHIIWSFLIWLTGNNLVFNDIQRNMKSSFSLTLRMVTKLLWRAFQLLHSPSLLIFIFSFVVVEDIYRRRQPFLSMDIAIYFIQPTKEK